MHPAVVSGDSGSCMGPPAEGPAGAAATSRASSPVMLLPLWLLPKLRVRCSLGRMCTKIKSPLRNSPTLVRQEYTDELFLPAVSIELLYYMFLGSVDHDQQVHTKGNEDRKKKDFRCLNV